MRQFPDAIDITTIVMWHFGTSDAPQTANEVASALDYSAGHIRAVIRDLWLAGLLTRARRQTPGRGEDPFEYHLAADV